MQHIKIVFKFTDFADIGKTFQYPFGEYNFHHGNINGIEDWFDLKRNIQKNLQTMMKVYHLQSIGILSTQN
ncbi:MAG: hypothetical protein CM15mV13_0530 [uncultured marine virus]|nr:MAG: hypothetical protein CM15mV13_0530 [uncultured marine virus]